MADQYPQGHANEATRKAAPADAQDRGLFDRFGKKEKPEEEVKVVTEPEHKSSLMEKLHRSSSSSSSSSSEEEIEEGGVMIKRKKNKMKGTKQNACEPGQNLDQDNKGFLGKIKEKLPGHQTDAHPCPPPAAAPPCCTAAATPPPDSSVAADGHCPEGEKKGIMERIREKLPGGGRKDDEEVKKDH